MARLTRCHNSTIWFSFFWVNECVRKGRQRREIEINLSAHINHSLVAQCKQHPSLTYDCFFNEITKLVFKNPSSSASPFSCKWPLSVAVSPKESCHNIHQVERLHHSQMHPRRRVNAAQRRATLDRLEENGCKLIKSSIVSSRGFIWWFSAATLVAVALSRGKAAREPSVSLKFRNEPLVIFFIICRWKQISTENCQRQELKVCAETNNFSKPMMPIQRVAVGLATHPNGQIQTQNWISVRCFMKISSSRRKLTLNIWFATAQTLVVTFCTQTSIK